MVRFVFTSILAMWTIVASFVGRCEQTSIAGMGMIRLAAILFPATTVSHASRNERIAGGRWVHNPLTYPWTVSINIHYNFSNVRRGRLQPVKRCTGSFIDIYGSILTAGHCLQKKQYCEDDEHPFETCKLTHAVISWGSISPSPNQAEGGTATVQEGDGSIKRFSVPGLQRLRGTVDVALIFLQRFAETPMSFHPVTGPRVRPIKLAMVIEQRQNWIHHGTFVGFGQQPVRLSETEWIYTHNNPLKEITMRYTGHFRKVCGVPIRSSTRPMVLFGAKAVINQPTDEEEQLPPKRRGPCLGDSGGPYMVMEGGEEKLRGFLVKSKCSARRPCVKVNDTSTFIDVNHERVRDWIINQLRERYNLMRVHVSAIPMTQMSVGGIMM